MFKAIRGEAVGAIDFKVPTTWPPTELTELNDELESREKAAETGGIGRWFVIAVRPERTLVGWVFVNRMGGYQAELSIEILPEFQRRGIATRATRTMVEYLFSRDDITCITVQSEEEAAVRILTKLGFKPSPGCEILFRMTREQYVSIR